jgi:hypothetical protein
LRPNDVAGSVLARRWLSGDRGAGGPALLYDRILLEFCLACGARVRLESAGDGSGQRIFRRVRCCPRQQLVYRSEFAERGTKTLKPKLGLIVAWLPGEEGKSAYANTAPLGPLWLCRRSGRYSLSPQQCQGTECQAEGRCPVSAVNHGWVLLPLSEAWDDLKATADPAAQEASGAVSPGDVRLLAEMFGELWPDRPHQFLVPADVWRAAADWPGADMKNFVARGGQGGLELLLRCKKLAEGQDGGTGGTGHDAID